MESVRRELLEKVGVYPSHHWLTDCWNALSLQRPQHSLQADDILEQIIHHDLRDVVRIFDEDDGGDSDSDTGVSLPSVQVRQAIRHSQQQQQQFKAQLPASFRLLVQVEEILDVSVNAMTRLEYGPTNSNTAPTPVGNQLKRCLKIAYTDGFVGGTGHSRYINQNNNINNNTENQPPEEILVAMEVQAIPDLSVHSRAGLKILLQGPLTIRRGVALWHGGTTTVVGGRVTALEDMQQQALQQAQRLAGVGVDPTVRALIGTQPLTTEDEANNDEGEHESGDVTAPPPAPFSAPPTAPFVATATAAVPPDNHHHYTPPPVAAVPSQPTPPRGQNPYSSNSNPYASNSTNGNATSSHPQNNNHNSNHGNISNTDASIQQAPAISHTSVQNPYGRRIAPANPYGMHTTTASAQTPPAVATTNAATSSRTHPVVSRSNNNNPYASSRNIRNDSLSPLRSARSKSTTAAAAAPTTMGSLTTTTAISGTRSATANNNNTNNTQNSHASVTTSTTTLSSGSCQNVANPYAKTAAKQGAVDHANAPASPDAIMIDDDDHDNGVGENNNNEISPQGSDVLPMEVDNDMEISGASSALTPFPELFATLQSLVESSRENYQLHLNKEWKVELQQVGARVDFNILGVKKPGSKKKEYTYWLLFKFGAPRDPSSRLITCQVDSVKVEAHLGHSAPDLRKLRKTESAKAQKICKDGGQRLLASIMIPKVYRVTLVDLPDNFWQQTGRCLDGTQPILYIKEA